MDRMATKGHNPTPEERDEKVTLYGVKPEEELAALLEVDPDCELSLNKDAEPD